LNVLESLPLLRSLTVNPTVSNPSPASMEPAAEVVDLSERRVIERARKGDQAAFATIYRTYIGRVYGLCLRMLQDPAAAEDCAQEAFISAWRNLPRFEGRSSLGTWLHRIAVNAVLGRNRRKEPVVQSDEPEEMPGACLPPLLDAMDVLDLEQLIAGLPMGARHVLVLQGVYGYTHEETAEFLGIAVGTCKAQLHRARKLLVERMTN
jgi:RNA polymerase sigma-70 factor (ECF subfamily)